MTTTGHLRSLVELSSRHSFEATLGMITEGIAQAGLQIFAHIDHAALASEAGLSMPPTIVLLYGNPKGGTPLMLDVPALALDLPLRMLVREDEAGKTYVLYHAVAAMLKGFGVAGDMISRLTPAQAWIASAIGADDPVNG